jgi:hypothetical protein
MAKGDRGTDDRLGGADPGGRRRVRADGQTTFAQAARKSWRLIVALVLLVGVVLAGAFTPDKHTVNNKIVIEKTQTRIVPTVVPGPTVRESNTTTVVEVKPGPTVTRTTNPRPGPTVTVTPKPSPSPTCLLHQIRRCP